MGIREIMKHLAECISLIKNNILYIHLSKDLKNVDVKRKQGKFQRLRRIEDIA